MGKGLERACEHSGFSGACKLLSMAGAQSLSGRLGGYETGPGRSVQEEDQVTKVSQGHGCFCPYCIHLSLTW